MPSTVIKAWDYDEPRNELTVEFVTGNVYVYSLVPAQEAAAMRASFSKGEYFNRHIRKYPFRQIKGDAPTPRKKPSRRCSTG
jgi:hypothetical protein